jgi:hypothetical protein
MTLEELKGSMLVEGLKEGYPNWDSEWRMKLVENLEVMVGQLRRVGIKEIFVNGSFVEDKDHPTISTATSSATSSSSPRGTCRGSLTG